MRSMAQRYFVHQVKQYYDIQTDEARIMAKRTLCQFLTAFSSRHRSQSQGASFVVRRSAQSLQELGDVELDGDLLACRSVE